MGRKKEVPDDELLDIARSCFLKHGPSVATGVIAKAAGVSQATLFNRFESKRRLMILSLAPQFPDELHDLLGHVPSSESISEQLYTIGIALYHTMRTNEPRVSMLYSAGVTWDEMVQTIELFPPHISMKQMIHWVERAQGLDMLSPSIDPRTVVMVFAGAIKNLAFDSLFACVRDDQEAIEQRIKQIIAVLWHGLAPHPQHQ